MSQAREAEKLRSAHEMVQRCIGKKGVWAAPIRYPDQCWTRDLGIAIAPLLLRRGQADIVRLHLENLSAQQRPNGQIPILFLDDEARFVAEKEAKSLAQGRPSFMLERYRAGELWNLTPGTRDSEIVYLLAMHEYAEVTRDAAFLERHRAHIDAALAYVEGSLMQDGLVVGCDWRDTMHEELGDKTLLTNNCLLHQVYTLMDKYAEASALKHRIREVLCIDGMFIDHADTDRFDPLGGALAVLYGVADVSHYDELVRSFRSVDSPCGVMIKCRHNPISAAEEEVIERTDGVVTWPFIVGFTVLALCKMRERNLAEEQFNKLTALEGFHEWYDPATGTGYGASEQLWSATLYARAHSDFSMRYRPQR